MHDNLDSLAVDLRERRGSCPVKQGCTSAVGQVLVIIDYRRWMRAAPVAGSNQNITKLQPTNDGNGGLYCHVDKRKS
jgi:hypothetical protein